MAETMQVVEGYDRYRSALPSDEWTFHSDDCEKVQHVLCLELEHLCELFRCVGPSLCASSDDNL